MRGRDGTRAPAPGRPLAAHLAQNTPPTAMAGSDDNASDVEARLGRAFRAFFTRQARPRCSAVLCFGPALFSAPAHSQLPMYRRRRSLVWCPSPSTQPWRGKWGRVALRCSLCNTRCSSTRSSTSPARGSAKAACVSGERRRWNRAQDGSGHCARPMGCGGPLVPAGTQSWTGATPARRTRRGCCRWRGSWCPWASYGAWSCRRAPSRGREASHGAPGCPRPRSPRSPGHPSLPASPCTMQPRWWSSVPSPSTSSPSRPGDPWRAARTSLSQRRQLCASLARNPLAGRLASLA